MKFSTRTNWSLQDNPLSQQIEKYRSQHVAYIDLTQSNPTQCGFSYPPAWLAPLSFQQNLVYDPVSKGIVPARQAIVDYYRQKSIEISQEQLVLTSSTSEAYSFLLKLLTDPGDHVLIPKPSYPLFQFLLDLHDVCYDYYPLTYQEGLWQIDQQAFKALVTPKTRAVIVVSPNNPTGSFLSSQDLAFLNQICAAHEMAMVADEVFLDYSLSSKDSARSLVHNQEVLCFTLSGISKILALPQMKLSWIAVSGPRRMVDPAIERLETIADTYLSVNTPVQNALAEWLSNGQGIQAQISQRVTGNLEALGQMGFDSYHIQAGWYAPVRVKHMKDEEEYVMGLLKHKAVLVYPGYFFDFEDPGHLVLSLLPKPEEFQEGIDKIRQFVV